MNTVNKAFSQIMGLIGNVNNPQQTENRQIVRKDKYRLVGYAKRQIWENYLQATCGQMNMGKSGRQKLRKNRK